MTARAWRWAAVIGLAALAAPARAAPDDPPPAEEEEPLTVAPAITRYVEAPYPPEAKAQGIEATVTVLVELDETGAVTSVSLLDGVGMGFDEAAIEAVRQMGFSPAETASGPVPIAFELAYDFKITPEAPPEAPPEPPAELPVNLEGLLRTLGNGRPVVGATVIVAGSDPAIEGKTAEDGTFSLRGVPDGTATLRIVATGFVPLERPVEVVAGEITTANLWMRPESYRENEAVGLYAPQTEEVTRRVLTIDEVRRVPGSFGDPVRIIQTLPGAARTPFGTGFLVIRGSNPEDSGVYVDGVRIPLIYHLTGTTSVLAPDLIEQVAYLPGGYGVQYGRSMGGTIDIKTKDTFETPKLTWGTDILDSQVYYEGPIGKNKKHGVAIGARRSYVDLFIPIFAPQGFTIKPRYWDYQVKWAIPTEGKASLFVYGFNDLVELGTPADVAQGSDQDTQGDLRTEYSSHRIVGHVTHPFSDTLSISVTPSVGLDYTLFGLGDSFTLDTYTILSELRVELPWAPTEHVEVVPGVDFLGGFGTFDFASPFRFVDADDPLAERESVSLTGNGTFWGPDPYLKANLRPLADPEALVITPGVRADIVTANYGGDITEGVEAPAWTIVAVDPRLSTRIRVVDPFVLKASTGLYHQPPQPFESVGVGTKLDLGFERAWASSLGFEQQVSQAVKWDVEGFYKDMDDLIVFREEWQGFGDQIFENSGVGRSYGVETILRHLPANHFFGWISYTLSRSERRDRPDAEWYRFDFDQTHILSAQGGYELPAGFGVSAQVQYVTGNPDQPYNSGVFDVDGGFYNPLGTEQEQSRLPPFFQTSFRVDKVFPFKRWQLETYVDLLNAVRGVNPEFTIYDAQYEEFAYVRGLPFIPNVGVEARFYP
jgi:TonB family protein